MYKIIFIGPGDASKGGIGKVISYYRASSFWSRNKILWIKTFQGGNSFFKFLNFISSFFLFFINVGFYQFCHIHLTSHSSSVRKLPFFLTAKFFRKKTIAHVHAPYLDIKLLDHWAFNYILKKSDKVIVLSDLWVKCLNDLIQRDYLIIPNPSKNLNYDNVYKESFILYAGKLEDRKGYLDLLYSLVDLDLKGFKVFLAGNGEIDKASDFIKLNNLNSVYLLGWLNEKEMDYYFKHAQIFVLPSYGEGFPVSIVDAISNKCAVITTPVGGIPDFLINDYNAIFVNPGDISALKTSINSLITDEKKRKFLANNGFETSKNHFNIDDITILIENVYKDLSE